jgi:hypothetical protein
MDENIFLNETDSATALRSILAPTLLPHKSTTDDSRQAYASNASAFIILHNAFVRASGDVIKVRNF